MYKALALTLLAFTASVNADISDFPSFDWTHANCAIDVTYQGKQCQSVFNSMYSLLTQYQQGDPGKGIYAFHDVSPSGTYIWVTRTTPVKKYIDDIAFEFSQSGSDCVVKSRSRSQSLSYYDYSTNFCNMWNPLHYTGSFVNQKVHDCKFPADDPATICNKY